MKIIIAVFGFINSDVIITRVRKLVKEIIIKKICLTSRVISDSPRIRYNFRNTGAIRREFYMPPKFSGDKGGIIRIFKCFPLFFPNGFNKVFLASLNFS